MQSTTRILVRIPLRVCVGSSNLDGVAKTERGHGWYLCFCCLFFFFGITTFISLVRLWWKMPPSVLPPLWAHAVKSNLKWAGCFRIFRTPASYFRSNCRSWPGLCLGNLEWLKNFTSLKCFCVQMSQNKGWVQIFFSTFFFLWGIFNY